MFLAGKEGATACFRLALPEVLFDGHSHRLAHEGLGVHQCNGAVRYEEGLLALRRGRFQIVAVRFVEVKLCSASLSREVGVHRYKP